MATILAIDPGTSESGVVLYSDGKVARAGVHDNESMRGIVSTFRGDAVAIEMVASYGMPVGAEVFETCVWIGRFVELSVAPVRLIYRGDVKLHLCGSKRAKDPNVRQALIDRFGPGKDVAIGRKASPGPLYDVKSHAWAALAVAVTATETEAA